MDLTAEQKVILQYVLDLIDESSNEVMPACEYSGKTKTKGEFFAMTRAQLADFANRTFRVAVGKMQKPNNR